VTLKFAWRRVGDLGDHTRPHTASTPDYPTIGPACDLYNRSEPALRDTLRTHPECFAWFRNLGSARPRHSCNTRGAFKLGITAVQWLWINLCDQARWHLQAEDLGQSTLNETRDSRRSFKRAQELAR